MNWANNARCMGYNSFSAQTPCKGEETNGRVSPKCLMCPRFETYVESIRPTGGLTGKEEYKKKLH